MLTPVILDPRRRRGKLKAPSPPAPPPPPAALMLVAVVYEESEFLTLTFDRPIDINALNSTAVIVDDAALSGMRWAGIGSGTPTGPASVQITLEATGPASGAGTTMTAGAGTGIVAVDDGGTWAGVSELELPFP